MAKAKTTPATSKKLDVYPSANTAVKGAQKRGESSVTFKLNDKPAATPRKK